MIEPGLTPLGKALLRVEQVLAEATDFDNLDSVLREIRREDKPIQFVRGYAGAWRIHWEGRR